MPSIKVRVNGPFSCMGLRNCYETEKGGVVLFGETIYNIYANSDEISVEGVEPIIDQELVSKISAVCRKLSVQFKALVYCEVPRDGVEHCVCISEFGVVHYVIYGRR